MSERTYERGSAKWRLTKDAVVRDDDASMQLADVCDMKYTAFRSTRSVTLRDSQQSFVISNLVTFSADRNKGWERFIASLLRDIERAVPSQRIHLAGGGFMVWQWFLFGLALCGIGLYVAIGVARDWLGGADGFIAVVFVMLCLAIGTTVSWRSRPWDSERFYTKPGELARAFEKHGRKALRHVRRT